MSRFYGPILLGLLAFVVARASVLDPFSALDQRADRWFRAAAVSAGAVYASVRLLNGSVSVLKESEFALEPAGVGVTLAVGQLLDPLDDMTERLSDVVVVAIIALGLQRGLHEMTSALAAPVLGCLLLAIAVARAVALKRTRSLQRLAAGLFGLVLAVRLAAPVAALTSDWLDRRFFAPPIEAARLQLEEGIVDLEGLAQVEVDAGEGVLGALRSAGRSVQARIEAFQSMLTRFRGRLDDLIASLLTLAGWYATMVLVQGLVVPLLVFGTLVAAVRALPGWVEEWRGSGTESGSTRAPLD